MAVMFCTKCSKNVPLPHAGKCEVDFWDKVEEIKIGWTINNLPEPDITMDDVINELNALADEAAELFEKWQDTDWSKAKRCWKVLQRAWDLRLEIARGIVNRIERIQNV